MIVISLETLKEGPVYFQPQETLPPVLTVEKVQEVTREKLDRVVTHAKKGGGRLSFLFGDSPSPLYFLLGHANAGEQYSNIRDFDNLTTSGRIESAQWQDAVLKLMKEYGWNESVSMPDPTMTSNQQKDAVLRQGHGVAIEWRAYPSQKFGGVTFTRARRFYEKTNETIGFAWHVRG